jgi:8-oxo-dGTP pyrophosphatase MutT (NUDIX family)
MDTLAAVTARLEARLAAPPLPGADAQARYAPHPRRKGWSPDQQPATARRAAALVLLYPGADGPSFPLTVRRHDLPEHAGQVSLPGGRIDGDESPVDAARREAEEEIGVPRGHVQIVGAMSSLWVVVSNHLLFPFIGVTHDRPDFRTAEREVAELIEVPLAAFLDPSTRGWSRHAREGIVIDYPHFTFGGHQVWGATAMVLGELGTLLDPEFEAPPR